MKRYGRVLGALALVAIIFPVCIALLRRPADPIFEGKPVSAWTHELLNSDYTTRENAKTALKTLGEPAVPQLRALLRHRNGPWETPLVRLSSVIPFLNYRPLDANACRNAASEVLGLLGSKSSTAAGDLVSALAYDASAAETERALVRIGSGSVPHLEHALQSRHDSVRVRAARLLREFSLTSSTIAALTGAAGDRSEEVREQVCITLGTHLGKGDSAAHAAAFDSLLSAARDSSAEVRAAAMQALGDAGRAEPRALSALGAGLRDRATIVSLQAAKSLWALHQPAESIVPVLIAILETSERWRAAYVLGDMGACAAPAVPALARLLVEERVPRPFRIPPSSAFALGKIGRMAIPELTALLQNQDPRVRMNALMAFGFMGPAGHEAVPQVMQVLKDDDIEVRHTAALTLASLGAEPGQMIASLSDCLHAEDIYMRSAAAAILRKIAPDQTWYVPAE